MKSTTTSTPRSNGRFAKRASPRSRAYLTDLALKARKDRVISEGHLTNIRVNNSEARKPSHKNVSAEISRLRSMIARHEAS